MVPPDAWAILVEALTQGLAGFGRAEQPKGWGACVFVQVIDPSAFGGREAFTRGVVPYPGVIEALRPAAEKLSVPMPWPITNHKS